MICAFNNTAVLITSNTAATTFFALLIKFRMDSLLRNIICLACLLGYCLGLVVAYSSDAYAVGEADDGGWLDVGKLDWGPISPVPYWPLPFLPPAWPLFPNRDFAFGYYPFPYTWGLPGYSRGFYGSNGIGGGGGGGYGK